MSNKETKERVANAFRAMKAIGISEDKVKPVLKSLLKLYDKNWALIEQENYRALADVIFERDESNAEELPKKVVNNEVAEQSKKIESAQTEDNLEEEVHATEEPEQPLKRLRRRYQDGQTSSLNTSNAGKQRTAPVKSKKELDGANTPKLNEKEVMVESPKHNEENTTIHTRAATSESVGKSKGKQPISPEPLVVPERCDPSGPSSTTGSQRKTRSRIEYGSQSHPMRLRERGKGVVYVHTPSRKKRRAPESSSHAVPLKESETEPSIPLSPKNKSNASCDLIKPKDEPITSDVPSLEVPGANVHPDTSNEGDSSSRGNCSSEPSETESVSEEETSTDSSMLNESRYNNEMAMVSGARSSNLEIASSTCGEVKIYLTCGFASESADFHMPSLEAVLKSVEDKCLRSHKTSDPYISMTKLMTETCQCFLKLGTDSSSQSPKTLNVTPTIDSVSKFSEMDAVGEKCRSSTRIPQPKIQNCNGINNGPLPNKIDAGDEIMTNTKNEENCAEEIDGPSLEVAPEITRSLNDVADIANGLENVVITMVNEVNDERPPFFRYIPQNVAFQNAYVNFSLARIGDNICCGTCSGDCLSLSHPCACSHETGGEFAYTTDGLVREEFLKECISMNRNPKKHCQYFCKECPLERSKCEDVIEPCKGHLVRKFIKECWWKCGCHKECGNRVVQRGITRKLQVFMTPQGKGWGLRTLEDLPKGAFICEYVGEVLTNAELFERVLKSPKGEKHSYPVLLDADWCAEGVLKDEEALCLDATYYGNLARFINHRCFDSNLVEIPVEVENPDHHYYHLAFFTTRKVKAMEELNWDYGIDFDDHEHPIKAFRCHCGSKSCRNIKRSRSRASRR
ncbi:hypothetical protein ABFS83_04G045400 [Erythranthe nasuta]